jgi:hypothetical protein
VNTFIWIMVHGKLLMTENIQKQGIVGPSRCPLCAKALQTMQHLFFDCSFSKKIGTIVCSTFPSYNLPSNWTEMFVHWKQRYDGNFNKKHLFHNYGGRFQNSFVGKFGYQGIKPFSKIFQPSLSAPSQNLVG